MIPHRSTLLFPLLAALLLAAAVADDAPPATPPTPPTPPPDAPVQITVDLTDGSRIIGVPIDITALPLKVEFGKLEIPLRLITQADFTANRAAFAIKLKNNDTYSGTLELDRIKLQTSYGQATIPLARIARITVREQPKP